LFDFQNLGPQSQTATVQKPLTFLLEMVTLVSSANIMDAENIFIVEDH
jgi:hypothetical protein